MKRIVSCSPISDTSIIHLFHNINAWQRIPVDSSFRPVLTNHGDHSEGRTHHHTDTSSCLGDGSQPVWQVVSDRAAHHRRVSREAVDELAGPTPVKKCHFLSEDGGEDGGTEITHNLLAWREKRHEWGRWRYKTAAMKQSAESLISWSSENVSVPTVVSDSLLPAVIQLKHKILLVTALTNVDIFFACCWIHHQSIDWKLAWLCPKFNFTLTCICKARWLTQSVSCV